MAKPKITYTATNPATGETVEIRTTREGITFVTFGFSDYHQEWVTGLTTAATPEKALKSAQSSWGTGNRKQLYVAPATRAD